MNKIISLLYSLLIGASIVTFIGLGAYAFYPGPDGQDCYDLEPKSAVQEPDDIEQRGTDYYDSQAFRECQNQYQSDRQDHASNVTIIGLAATVAITTVALLAPISIGEIKDGVALGGVMTAVYSTIWAGIAEHRVLVFISGSLFLASAILTGYSKFKH